MSFCVRKFNIADDKIKYYVHWVNEYINYCEEKSIDINSENIRNFLLFFAKKHESWQVKQAEEAIRKYLYFIRHDRSKDCIQNTYDIEWQKIADEVKEIIRLKHFSLNTEKIYLGWLRKFYSFLKGKNPAEITNEDIKDFISSLAVERKISSSTQNQAFNAILVCF